MHFVDSLFNSKKSQKSNLEWIHAICIGILLLVTYITYSPSIQNDFTNWDDDKYVASNPLINRLTTERIQTLFALDDVSKAYYMGNYHPLTMLSYAVDYQRGGSEAKAYHATNLWLHLANTILVYLLIFMISRSLGVSLITSLLFAIHPMHVESVAWIAERKDLLYTLFYLGTLCAYVFYTKRQHYFFLILCVFLFVLSLLSKAMAASLAPMLVLVDIYYKRGFNLRVIIEKVPFFGLALLFGLIAIKAQKSAGAIEEIPTFSFFENIALVSSGIITYLWKLILPYKLSCFYPYPEKIDGSIPFVFWIYPLVLISIIALSIYYFRKNRVFLFGTGFFLISIALVLQILPVGSTIISDRYTYIPYIGLFFIMAMGIQFLVTHSRFKKLSSLILIIVFVYSSVLAHASYKRTQVWKNSLTLWNDCISKYDNIPVAYNNRGNYYGKVLQMYDKALADFNTAIHVNPTYPNSYCNKGIVHSIKGEFDLALENYNKAIQLKGQYKEALVNRGITNAQQKKYDIALKDFDEVLTFTINDPTTYFNRGCVYSDLQDYSAAINDFNQAISISPRYADAYFRRSYALAMIQQYENALRDVQTAKQLGFPVQATYENQLKALLKGKN